MNGAARTIALGYLARGADEGWLTSCRRFMESYQRHDPGIDHSLYVIFKGFASSHALKQAQDLFCSVPHTPVLLDDMNFDIGAYIEWANGIDEDLICVCNTGSEVLASRWLQKLAVNLTLPNVGLVGATASYESLSGLQSAFPAFPNIHIRSTAFMIDRQAFCRITDGLIVRSKIDAYYFESGPSSMTRQVLTDGQEVLLVGRNGRGYSPKHWATSDTFWQRTQNNLLVADNQTRAFAALPWPEKQEVVRRTWGRYLADDKWLKEQPSRKRRSMASIRLTPAHATRNSV